MVGLWVHCLLLATIASGGAGTWELGSLFLVTPVPSSCFWDATVWVSYVVGLGEPAFLWLLVNLPETWTAGPDKPVGIVSSVFWPEGSATSPVSVGPDRPWGRTGSLQNRRSAFAPVLIFPNSPANLVLGKSSLNLEYAGDKPGGIWPSPTSRLGTGGFLYPGVWPSVSPPLLL